MRFSHLVNVRDCEGLYLGSAEKAGHQYETSSSSSSANLLFILDCHRSLSEDDSFVVPYAPLAAPTDRYSSLPSLKQPQKVSPRNQRGKWFIFCFVLLCVLSSLNS
jgi:hypothetical protein